MPSICQLSRRISSVEKSVRASWPLGCILLSTNDINPSISLGFGAWVAFGVGKMLIGFDPNDTDFDADEEVGGAKQRVIETLLTNGVLPQYIVVRMWKRTA